MARACCERALACAQLTYEDSHFLGIILQFFFKKQLSRPFCHSLVVKMAFW